MDIATLRDVLFWCTIINYGVLLFWWLLMVFPHQRLYRFWFRWCRLSAEQIDVVSFVGIAFYKTLIIMFNLVPYVALLIAG